jgi:hypothetical protein
MIALFSSANIQRCIPFTIVSIITWHLIWIWY